MSTIAPPDDNPPRGCGEQEFAEWASGFRQRRSAALIAQKVHPERIRQQVDLEVEAARRRNRPIDSEVVLPS